MESKIAANWPGWEIVRQIGSGNYGAVYEIRRDNLGYQEKAALKVISVPKNRSDLDELYSSGMDSNSISLRYRSYLEDIVGEYKLMDELKGNTNIVYCDDIKYVQHDDGIGWDIYIKMELLTPMLRTLGETTDDSEVIRLGMHLCNALMVCKSRNIVHRDIKPQNIFVSRDGYYKLGDFGVARTVEGATTGTKVGTFNYMAPEVYLGRPYGAAADIYSLGIVMYWMLNKRRGPFLPVDANYTVADEEEARRRRFTGEELPRPVGGSRRLQDIVLKACSFAPENRYLSAADMLNDLKSLNRDVVSDGIIDGVMASVIGKDAPDPRAGTGNNAEAGHIPEKEPEWNPTVKVTPAEPSVERAAPAATDPEPVPAPKKKRRWIPVLVMIAVIAILGGIAGMIASSDLFEDVFSSSDRGGRDDEDDRSDGENGSNSENNGNGESNSGEDGDSGDVTAQLEWSDWTTTLPGDVYDGSYVVEAGLQYRSAHLYYYIGGETLTDEFTVCYTGYGEWSSEWSAWQTEPITATDRMEVEEGTRYWYRDGYWKYYDDIRRDTPENPWEWKWKSPQYSDNVLPEAKEGRERLTSQDQTIYRYRTRPITYYCVKDSEWSEYGNEVLCPSHDTVVSTRVVYRYAKAVGGAKTPSMENFPKTLPIYTSRFADVPNNKWYGAQQGNWAGIAVEIGAMSANEYLCFRPEENITIGELIKAAVTLRRIYNGEPIVMQKTTPWYGSYVDYAIETGIIEAGVFSDYGKTATRAEAAYILGRALPEEEYGKRNTVRAITDMDASSIYFKSVWRLAESGVIAWENPEGAYTPDRNISRAEVAAMIGRVAYPDKRVGSENG